MLNYIYNSLKFDLRKIVKLFKKLQKFGACFGQMAGYLYITYLIMQIPVGALVDRFGAQRLIILNTFIFGFACMLFSFAKGIVIAESFATLKQHHRIRVMWLGDLPIQAKALATSKNKRVTTWVNPKYFFVISRPEDKENEMDEESFTSQA